MKILLTFGKIDFEAISKNWNGQAKDVSTEIHGMLQRGKYLYKVCSDQEVFEVAKGDENRWVALKAMIDSEKWINQSAVDMDKYQFARQVIFW